MTKKETLTDKIKELCSTKQLKVNLIGSCFIWLLSSFNFYLTVFYLKRFPGSVYFNSLTYAFSDIIAFTMSGLILKFYTVKRGLRISYSLSFIGGISYLCFFSSQILWLIPILVCLCRIGASMSFNIGYISVSRLFPTKYITTVFSIVNFCSNMITMGAPMVAETPEPIPFIVFCINAFVALFIGSMLKEIEKKEIS